MFLQKNNPYHDKAGRFTSGRGGARAAASAATPYGSAYSPAKDRILNPDGSLNIEMAKRLADHPDVRYAIPQAEDHSLVVGREIQGFNGPPHLVKREEFDSLSGQSFYRGDTKREYSEEIKHGVFRGGQGAHGNGTYAAKDPIEAGAYTGRYDGNMQGGMIRFKMHPDARITQKSNGVDSPGMRFGDVLKGIDSAERTGDLHSEQAQSLKRYFRDDGRLAAALGYDAFIPGEFGLQQNHIVVLNRTAMVISDESSDTDSVLHNSKESVRLANAIAA
jgi:hypothetical protein